MKWAQFSIRSILLLMLGVAIFAGTVQRERALGVRSQEVIAAVQARGFQLSMEPGRFASLRQRIGDEFVQDVPAVEAHGYNTGSKSPVNDDVEALGKLLRLRSIDFSHTILSDAALAHLKHLHIETANLTQTNVTDKGIEGLQTWSRHLRELNLSCCSDVTSESLPSLSKLDRLQKLDISYTRITKSEAEQLRKNLPNCNVVWVEN